MQDTSSTTPHPVILPEIYQRDLNLNELFSKAWYLYKTHFLKITFILLIIYLPVKIAAQYIPVPQAFASFEKAQADAIYMYMLAGFESFFGIIATLAIILLIKNASDGVKLSVGFVLAKSLKLWPAALITTLMMAIMLMGLAMLLIIPAIIFGVYWSFYMYNIAVYERWGIPAIEHSKAIVKGRWWTVFFYHLMITLIVMLVVMIIGTAEYILPDIMAAKVGIGLINAIVSSFMTVFFTVFFINCDRESQGKNLLKHIETYGSEGLNLRQGYENNNS